MNIETKDGKIFIDGAECIIGHSIQETKDTLNITFIRKKEWQWPEGLPIIDKHGAIIMHQPSWNDQNGLIRCGWSPYWEYVFLFAPEWAQWAAMDEDGYWQYFLHKPEKYEIGFHCDDNSQYFTFFTHPDWKNSLIQRNK